jgi:hypothetical protein
VGSSEIFTIYKSGTIRYYPGYIRVYAPYIATFVNRKFFTAAGLAPFRSGTGQLDIEIPGYI